MNNFAAVVGNVKVGRYPFGISLSPDDKRLYVANVGVSQFKNLSPAVRTGDNNIDFPLCYPGDRLSRTTRSPTRPSRSRSWPPAGPISGLPTSLRDPEGIRCGYVSGDQDYTIPALGDPNADESSSVYVLDLATPAAPAVTQKVKTGLKVGEVEHGITTTGGSHPNAVAVGSRAVYVSNGNNDSISVLDPGTLAVVSTFSLAPLAGADKQLRGVQPVSLALSPDGRTLYVGRGRPQLGGRAEGERQRRACRWPATSPPAGGRARSSCRPTAGACSSPAPRAAAPRPTWWARSPTRTGTPNTRCSDRCRSWTCRSMPRRWPVTPTG